MGASSEIRLKIGGDTASLERSFAKLPAMAEAAGRKAESAFNRNARLGASAKLSQFREQQQFNDASTVGKVKIITEQLSDLAYARSRTEKNTAAYLKTQLEIEQKLVTLRKLQKQAQTERVAGMTPADGGGGGGDRPSGNFATMAFRVIGGAIAFGLQRVIAWNESRVRVAQAQEQSRSAGLDSLRTTFAARRGQMGELEQGKGRLNDLTSQRDIEQQRVDFLSSGMQGAVSALAPEELTKAQEAVERLNGEIQKQHNLNQLIERDIGKQADILVAQDHVQASIRNAKQEGIYSDAMSARLEADRLETLLQRDVEEKRIFQNTPEYDKRQLEVNQADADARSAERAMIRRRSEVREQLTSEAAQGRTFANGARRPRSETERLADRAEQFRQRARNAVLTGASGEAAFMTNKARGLEQTVSERLMRGSSEISVPKGTEDATAIKPTLEQANNILTAIKDALTPQGIN